MAARATFDYLRAQAAYERLPVLVCRECGSEAIRSVDVYVGTCLGGARLHPDGTAEFEGGGYTEIHWDGCKQIGWDCGSCEAEAIAPAPAEGEGRDLDALLAAFTMTRDAWFLAQESSPSTEGAPA